jgi:predicted XRE-type DNA-binding protein
MSKFIDYEVSSGNVFKDLSLPNTDELQAKADLAIEIGHILSKRGLSQMKAAAILGTDQPKVSALIRGHLEKFSIARLCEYLRRLGCDVNIQVEPKNRAARGRMKVQVRA